jgi:hypothetical protein
VSLKFAPLTMLYLNFSSALVALAFMWFGSQSASLGGFWFGCFLWGASLASSFPTALNLAESLMPLTGTSGSIFMVGASAVRIRFPNFGSFAQSHGAELNSGGICDSCVVRVVPGQCGSHRKLQCTSRGLPRCHLRHDRLYCVPAPVFLQRGISDSSCPGESQYLSSRSRPRIFAQVTCCSRSCTLVSSATFATSSSVGSAGEFRSCDCISTCG